MATNVYVDGFNLYYGAVQGTTYKWLDLEKLARHVFPAAALNRVRYFTAKIKPPPNDPQQAQRQQTYLRALRTLPGLTVHMGHFIRHAARMPLEQPVPPGTPGTKVHADGGQSIRVIKTEEKGSDVNLASYLLWDAFEKDYDDAIVFSNDGDLREPIRIVCAEIGKRVIVVNPQRGKRISAAIAQVCPAGDRRELRTSALRACQFPNEFKDSQGKTIRKPAAW